MKRDILSLIVSVGFYLSVVAFLTWNVADAQSIFSDFLSLMTNRVIIAISTGAMTPRIEEYANGTIRNASGSRSSERNVP